MKLRNPATRTDEQRVDRQDGTGDPAPESAAAPSIWGDKRENNFPPPPSRERQERDLPGQRGGIVKLLLIGLLVAAATWGYYKWDAVKTYPPVIKIASYFGIGTDQDSEEPADDESYEETTPSGKTSVLASSSGKGTSTSQRISSKTDPEPQTAKPFDYKKDKVTIGWKIVDPKTKLKEPIKVDAIIVIVKGRVQLTTTGNPLTVTGGNKEYCQRMPETRKAAQLEYGVLPFYVKHPRINRNIPMFCP